MACLDGFIKTDGIDRVLHWQVFIESARGSEVIAGHSIVVLLLYSVGSENVGHVCVCARVIARRCK